MLIYIICGFTLIGVGIPVFILSNSNIAKSGTFLGIIIGILLNIFAILMILVRWLNIGENDFKERYDALSFRIQNEQITLDDLHMINDINCQIINSKEKSDNIWNGWIFKEFPKNYELLDENKAAIIYSKNFKNESK